MKAVGLIGGTRWESTVPYYRAINETVRTRLGGLHSARLLPICANTVHEVAPAVEAAAGLPLLHVADATAEAILAAGHRAVDWALA